jgi:nitrite reductase (NO-forming)
MPTIDLLSKSVNRRRFLALSGSAAAVGAVAATCGSNIEWENPPGSGRATWEAGQEASAQRAAQGATATAEAHAAGGGDDHSMPPSDEEGRPKASGDLATVYDATLPPLDPNPVKDLVIEAIDKEVEVAAGVMLDAWTYDGVLPGKVVHVRQGDTINFTLRNSGDTGHSIDFHAARTPWDKNYITILPDEELSFTWTADYPGVYMYHCGTGPVIQHIANGMYGAVIVDPPTPLAPAREYVLVQSEFYLSEGDNGVWKTDLQRTLKSLPDFVVFNGAANQYQQETLKAAPGELIRLHLMNAGPTTFSAFHVIGALFDRVYIEGNPANELVGIQTWTVPPGGGATFELVIPEPGLYPFVTHSFAYTGLGAVGLIEVA